MVLSAQRGPCRGGDHFRAVRGCRCAPRPDYSSPRLRHGSIVAVESRFDPVTFRATKSFNTGGRGSGAESADFSNEKRRGIRQRMPRRSGLHRTSKRLSRRNRLPEAQTRRTLGGARAVGGFILGLILLTKAEEPEAVQDHQHIGHEMEDEG